MIARLYDMIFKYMRLLISLSETETRSGKMFTLFQEETETNVKHYETILVCSRGRSSQLSSIKCELLMNMVLNILIQFRKLNRFFAIIIHLVNTVFINEK